MRASLDTNAIIHFYKAECQNILFDFFKDGVFIYEQIRNIELENHGFVKELYREEERRWLQSMTKDKGISIKQKFSSLSKLI